MAEQVRQSLIVRAPKGEEDGTAVCVNLSYGAALFVFDINSMSIASIDNFKIAPEILKAKKFIKINYCVSGRCELQLRSGNYIYLSSGEIAVDTGQARNDLPTFYYPTGQYDGVELVVVPGKKWNSRVLMDGSEMSAADRLYDICSSFEQPGIIPAGSKVAEDFRLLMRDGLESSKEVIMLDVVRILELLAGTSLEQERSLKFYTKSQVDIAKKVKEIITSDLSKRHSAAELAKMLGVSETSLKNYFRGVYDCGYKEYQNKLRMEYAAKKLRDTDEPVGDICEVCGFVSQSKFGKAFKEFYGVTPLEYRRRTKLESLPGKGGNEV